MVTVTLDNKTYEGQAPNKKAAKVRNIRRISQLFTGRPKNTCKKFYEIVKINFKI